VIHWAIPEIEAHQNVEARSLLIWRDQLALPAPEIKLGAVEPV